MIQYYKPCLMWIEALLIFLSLSHIRLYANQYTVGVSVNDTISEPFTYGTPCTDGSLEFMLDDTLIPYVTGLQFQVEITETNGLVLSNIIDTVQAGDKIAIPTAEDTERLRITLPVSDDAFTFITTISGTPQIADETYRCHLSWAITEAVCHNTFEIYAEDTVLCTVQPSTGLIYDHQKRPIDFILYQNYPNPFNTSTVITYLISKENLVSLKVYNLLGNEIFILVNVYQHKGKYTVHFQTASLSSGIYFYRLQVGKNLNEIRKMILIK